MYIMWYFHFSHSSTVATFGVVPKWAQNVTVFCKSKFCAPPLLLDKAMGKDEHWSKQRRR